MKTLKDIISEQGQYGYHCINSVCVAGTQGNPGPYPNPTVCSTNCGPGVCPAGHPFNSWPSGYPTGQVSFTWTGPSIVNLGGWGTPINYATGSQMPGTYANWFNAGQSSYCEWCADYDAGSVGVPNSLGFDIRTNYWAGGPYDSSACACCPGSNPMGPALPRKGQQEYYTCDSGCEPMEFKTSEHHTKTPDGIDTFWSQTECQQICGIDTKGNYDVCCNWCEDHSGYGRPPQGCYDWDCDTCTDDYTTFSDLREDINRIKQLLK